MFKNRVYPEVGFLLKPYLEKRSLIQAVWRESDL